MIDEQISLPSRLQQRYRDVYQFLVKHRLPTKWGEYYRLTERKVGVINGLPKSRGVLTATDGILCFIEQVQDDGTLQVYRGHVQYFIPDDGEPLALPAFGKKPARPAPKRDLSIYDDL